MLNQNKEETIKRLIKEPVPLYHKDFPLILFWSPKGGCTSLIKWFFFQVGSLQKATDYNPWIHLYRMEVYQNQHNYNTELAQQLANHQKATYKLVRNPYKRAVSSFLATITNKTINQDIAPNHLNGLSFKQFLYLVKKTGVSRDKVNLHIAQQYTEGEEAFIQHYIKLEQFESEIRNIEHKYHLLSSPISKIIKSPHHMTQNMTTKGSFADKTISIETFNNPLPTYESFYDKETIDLVKELYRNDFQLFGYDSANL